MDNILEVSGINKSYDDFSLKDISFYLPEGCITGFVGINGAGKTTTLRSILGLTNNVSGKINFFGMDIKGNESEIKDRIGIVLDDGCFYAVYLSVNTRKFMRSIISVSRLVTERWSDTLAKMELARVQQLRYSAVF